MKKAFLLIEVLISVLLITGVIATLLKIKNNNLYFLEKVKKDKIINSSFLAFILQENKNSSKNKEYLSDIYTFKNDKLRKIFKDIKVIKKSKKISTKTLKTDALLLKIDTYETSYKISDDFEKIIYFIKLKKE